VYEDHCEEPTSFIKQKESMATTTPNNMMAPQVTRMVDRINMNNEILLKDTLVDWRYEETFDPTVQRRDTKLLTPKI
jgi:hypothetical protein